MVSAFQVSIEYCPDLVLWSNLCQNNSNILGLFDLKKNNVVIVNIFRLLDKNWTKHTFKGGSKSVSDLKRLDL